VIMASKRGKNRHPPNEKNWDPPKDLLYNSKTTYR
jgi:hypothetical protein